MQTIHKLALVSFYVCTNVKITRGESTFHSTVFSQLNAPGIKISNLAWWTRRLFGSPVYLSSPFFKKRVSVHFT